MRVRCDRCGGLLAVKREETKSERHLRIGKAINESFPELMTMYLNLKARCKKADASRLLKWALTDDLKPTPEYQEVLDQVSRFGQERDGNEDK